MEKIDLIKLITEHIKKIDLDLSMTVQKDPRAEMHKAKSMALQSLAELIK